MPQQQYKEEICVRTGLDFDFDGDDVPRYWLDGCPYKSRVIDAVQATFPDGERYFIASVRAYRDQIDDPELEAEVKDFMMQEGQHGQVHTRYNERLARQGIAIHAFTRHTKRITERRLKHFPASYNLALTAALEHFTAMMADLFFGEKDVLEGAEPRLRAMLAWHAVEEMEHKAVAFDVMKNVAKVGYFQRCLAMTHAIFGFGLYCLIAPWKMLKMDGFSRGQRLRMMAKRGGWMFHLRKGIFPRLLPMLLSYYRPGFHPNQLKTVHSYDTWLEAYEREHNPLEAGEAMYAAAR